MPFLKPSGRGEVRFRATGRFGLGSGFGLAAAAVVTDFAAWPAAAFVLFAAFEASSAATRVAGAAAADPLLPAFAAAVVRAVLAGDVDFGAAFVFAATFVFGAALALADALAFLAVSVATLPGLAVVDGAAAALAFDLDGAAAALALTVFFGAAAASFDRAAVFAVAFGAVLALFVVAAAAVFAERSVVDVDLEAVGGLRRALVDLDLDEDVFDAVAVIGLGFRMADQTGRRNGDRPYRPGRLARTLGSSSALSS